MEEANKFFNKLTSSSVEVAKLGTIVTDKGTTNNISMYDVELADGTTLLNVPSTATGIRVGSLVVLVVVDSDIDNIIFGGGEANTSRTNNITDSVIVGVLRS